jgi:phosphoglycolate phosphatase
MRYRLAIFDFDGTLADSFPWFLGVVNDVADEFGFRQVPDEDIDLLRRYDARQIMAHLGLPMWKVPLVARALRARMAAEIDRIPLFPGVEELLATLAAGGIELALVTSNSQPNAMRVLGARNAQLFRHFECGASIFGKRSKLRKVLRGSGVAAAQAIAIGDELRDLDAAEAERIPFGGVSWGYARPEALRARQPAELFDSVTDIIARLL